MLLLMLNAFLLWSCSTTQISTTQVSSGTPILIESKARIKNNNEENNVQITMALRLNQVIRMEITGTLGYRVATVLMTPQKIQYAIHLNKSYYEGPMRPRSLYPIFKKNIDPILLWKIVHGANPQGADLKCSLDEKKRPILCLGSEDLTINWTYENDSLQRRIDLKRGPFEMAWIFKSQSLLAADQNETFVLNKPEGYKEIILK